MRLLAIDIDDTLIGSDKILKASTIESLNARLREGDVLALVSGRPYRGIDRYLSQFLPLKKHAIAANGAAVYDRDGTLLFSRTLPYRDFLHFYAEHESIRAYGGEIYCYTLDDVGYFAEGFFVDMERRLNGVGGVDLLRHPLKDDAPLLKIMTTLPKEEAFRLVPSAEDEAHYHILRSDPMFLEFTEKSVDKAVGVEFLRQRYGLRKEDVYTFGDQGNDVGMIEAYQGVAMGNAIDRCKKVARYVTLSANEDGVSYALEHFVK